MCFEVLSLTFARPELNLRYIGFPELEDKQFALTPAPSDNLLANFTNNAEKIMRLDRETIYISGGIDFYKAKICLAINYQDVLYSALT
jgi:hypothetical protein